MRSMRRESIGAPYEFPDDVLARMYERWKRVFEEEARKMVPVGAARDAYSAYLAERIGSESGEPPPEMPIPMDGTWERVLDD
jgi:hypothetical protein